MLAVIQTGSKQYKVKEKQVIKIEKLAGEPGDILDFSEVLLISDDKEEIVKIGEPFITGAKVSGKILEQGKDKKIDVIKFKNKTRSRKKYGHRQPYTRVEIVSIV